MPTPSYLVNLRHFPRAPLALSVSGEISGSRWEAVTRNVSLGGCQVTGVVRSGKGDGVALDLRHARVPRPWSLTGRVVRCDAASVSIAFDGPLQGKAGLRAWLELATVDDELARRVLTQTPSRLPAATRLSRANLAPGRELQPTEAVLLAEIDPPCTLAELIEAFGPVWERACQPLFTLIAEGLVEMRLPPTIGRKELEGAEGAGEAFGETVKLVTIELPLPKVAPGAVASPGAADKKPVSWLRAFFKGSRTGPK